MKLAIKYLSQFLFIPLIEKLFKAIVKKIEDWNKDRIERRALEEAKKYLSETDYMLLRELDGGEPMPLEVKNQRAAKRVLINSLETQFDL